MLRRLKESASNFAALKSSERERGEYRDSHVTDTMFGKSRSLIGARERSGKNRRSKYTYIVTTESALGRYRARFTLSPTQRRSPSTEDRRRR